MYKKITTDSFLADTHEWIAQLKYENVEHNN